MRTPIQPLTLLVVAVAGWIKRDQQAAIVYLLEENRVLKARLRGRKLRFTDDERLVSVDIPDRDGILQSIKDFLGKGK